MQDCPSLRAVFDIALGVAYSLALLWVLCGSVFRIYIWLKARSRFSIPLAPAPRSRMGVVGRLLVELFAFRSLARANESTWFASMAFHYSLLWLLIVHLRFVFENLPVFLLPFIRFSGWASLFLILGICVLFFRRVFIDRIRYISTPSDYLHLLLIAGIGLSGVLLKRAWPVNLYEVGEFARGVLTLAWTALPPHPGLWFHLMLVLILLLVFPVSKLLHGLGIVFSPTFNQRDSS